MTQSSPATWHEFDRVDSERHEGSVKFGVMFWCVSCVMVPDQSYATAVHSWRHNH